MARPHSFRLTVAALLLLAAAVAILASLGRWQLHRADERRATLAAIEAGRAQAPVALAADTPAGELRAWRPAQGHGQWLPDLSVLLENRNQGGRPGYWLATPLLLEPARRQAVLVLRGWLPRSLDGTPPALPAPPSGDQDVAGELSSRVPRLFELWSFGQPRAALPAALPAAGGVPTVQNLDLADYAQATGLSLLPAVLMQTRGEDGLVRQWPQPSVDYNQNLGYAMQWFSFAGIAAIAWLAVAVRAWRRGRRAGS
ncbi:SURF1 family protein [Bordetella genomosp. 13]|uniref:SURF1 family protein n=1 Tax=Bordetella genomosp. 13 TaxID=463040 RepID=UPI0011A899A9|nr:SURF1 family protein [Bordetella genomosp. 13]